MNPFRPIPVLALSVASALLTAHTDAALIASETFNYAAGSLSSASGGTGWSSSWAGGSTNVTSPGLTLSGIGDGNKLTTNPDNNGAFRNLSLTLGTDGTTVWLGYLTSFVGTVVANDYAGLSLFQDGSENLFTGKRTGQSLWGVERSGGGGGGDSAVAADGSTHYLVFKLEFGAGTTAGNERITMWVDPTPGLANPDTTAAVTLPDVNNFTFNRIRIQSGGSSSFNVDEVRIGTTYADVPEPVAAVSLALGGAALLARRRRKG